MGSSPSRAAFSRSSVTQKLSMVQICARRASALCRLSRAASAPGSAARSAKSAPILLRSCSAAARVKVMMRKLSTSTGRSASNM